MTSEALAEDIRRTTGQDVRYIDGFDEVETYLVQNAVTGDLVLTMGAGDVYRIGEEVLRELREVEP